MTEPLTDEEIEQWREQLARRAIATIDAERAARRRAEERDAEIIADLRKHLTSEAAALKATFARLATSEEELDMANQLVHELVEEATRANDGWHARLATSETRAAELEEALELLLERAKADPRLARHIAGHTCECCPSSVQTSQDQYDNPCTLRAVAHAAISGRAALSPPADDQENEK